MRHPCLAAAVALAFAAGPCVAHGATVSLVRGVVTYTAAPGEANRVTVLRTPSVVRIIEAGAPLAAGAGCTVVAPGTAECPAGGVRRVTVDAGDRDDHVTTSLATETIARGGDGDDVLEGGEGPDTLTGGVGDDRLLGGNGADYLDGSAGADDLSGGTEKSAFADVDVVSYPRTSAVRVTIDDVADDGEPGEGDSVHTDVEAVLGGRGNDVIVGNGERLNALFGGGGADRLYGRGGMVDLLLGEAGPDRLYGERGTDLIAGGNGDDRLSGGRGDDLLEGEAGDDVLLGASGDDELAGGPGGDTHAAGPGDDALATRDGRRDAVLGGPGYDRGLVDRRLDFVRGVEILAGQTPAPSAELTGRPARAYLRSLLDSMSNHMAKSRSWRPEITRRATRTIVAAGMGFPAMRRAVSTIPRRRPTEKNARPSP